jgi:hypothetical protein
MAADPCVDMTAPIINCLAAENPVPATGPDGTTLNLHDTITAVDDCDVSPIVVCDPPANLNMGILYPIGTTTVTCLVMDQSGKTNACSFNVIVGVRPIKALLIDPLSLLSPSAKGTDFGKFNAAINYLIKSTNSTRWLDEAHPRPGAKGEEVFNNEKSAVSQLISLRAKYPAVQPYIESLVDADQLIAEIAIADAIARNGNAAKIQAAQNYLGKGDADAAANKPTNAIDDYKNAWKNAVGA